MQSKISCEITKRFVQKQQLIFGLSGGRDGLTAFQLTDLTIYDKI